jgi:hypothetical protein|tara:strand:+ start:702 stop:968 length:267 start_codon:yes stop_codon:yes gene_type:complete
MRLLDLQVLQQLVPTGDPLFVLERTGHVVGGFVPLNLFGGESCAHFVRRGGMHFRSVRKRRGNDIRRLARFLSQLMFDGEEERKRGRG